MLLLLPPPDFEGVNLSPLLALSLSNDGFEILVGAFSFSPSSLLLPLLPPALADDEDLLPADEMRDFVVLAIFGMEFTRVVVDAALDGLAGRGAGLDGPPAASDEAVAAA